MACPWLSFRFTFLPHLIGPQLSTGLWTPVSNSLLNTSEQYLIHISNIRCLEPIIDFPSTPNSSHITKCQCHSFSCLGKTSEIICNSSLCQISCKLSSNLLVIFFFLNKYRVEAQVTSSISFFAWFYFKLLPFLAWFLL